MTSGLKYFQPQTEIFTVLTYWYSTCNNMFSYILIYNIKKVSHDTG